MRESIGTCGVSRGLLEANLENTTGSTMTRLLTLTVSLFFLLSAACAEESGGNTDDNRFQKGVHYHETDSTTSTDSDRVEVVEVFSYACPGCNAFLPRINQWHENKPDHVEFRRVPVVFQRSWEPFARAYFTAEVLDIVEDGHAGLFNALHAERQAIRNMDDLAEFWSEYGVDKDEFLSASRSFSVDSKLRQSRNNISRWAVPGTPSMVVNGKWRITAGNNIDHGTIIEVLDYLVEKEYQRIQAASDNGADHNEESAEASEDADDEGEADDDSS